MLQITEYSTTVWADATTMNTKHYTYTLPRTRARAHTHINAEKNTQPRDANVLPTCCSLHHQPADWGKQPYCRVLHDSL